jgi:hypothetical protein
LGSAIGSAIGEAVDGSRETGDEITRELGRTGGTSDEEEWEKALKNQNDGNGKNVEIVKKYECRWQRVTPVWLTGLPLKECRF